MVSERLSSTRWPEVTPSPRFQGSNPAARICTASAVSDLQIRVHRSEETLPLLPSRHVIFAERYSHKPSCWGKVEVTLEGALVCARWQTHGIDPRGLPLERGQETVPLSSVAQEQTSTLGIALRCTSTDDACLSTSTALGCDWDRSACA